MYSENSHILYILHIVINIYIFILYLICHYFISFINGELDFREQILGLKPIANKRQFWFGLVLWYVCSMYVFMWLCIHVCISVCVHICACSWRLNIEVYCSLLVLFFETVFLILKFINLCSISNQ